MKNKTITFKDKSGKPCEFKTPSGPVHVAIILAKYPAGVTIGTLLKDGRQAVTIAKGLEPDRIAANHKAHYSAKDLEIVKEWKEI